MIVVKHDQTNMISNKRITLCRLPEYFLITRDCEPPSLTDYSQPIDIINFASVSAVVIEFFSYVRDILKPYSIQRLIDRSADAII